MTATPIPVGQAFGKLRVVGAGVPYVTPDGKRHTVRWRVLCACGRTVDVIPSNLRAGRTKTCGCAPNTPPPPALCIVNGCGRKHYARTLCHPHYVKHQAGRPLIGPVFKVVHLCKIDGCGRISTYRSARLCKRHYSQRLRARKKVTS